MEKRNMTVKEFQEYMNISRQFAYEIVNDKGFYPAFRVKGKILVNVDRLEKWIDEQSNREG